MKPRNRHIAFFSSMLSILSLLILLPPATRGQEPPTATMSGAKTEPATKTAESELEVVHLANEGFLLRSGEQAVLIDAFVTEPYSIYSAVPAAVWETMLAGDPPFGKVQVALASHVHADHFQPEAAGAFLEKHPETIFASSPQVIEALREGYERIAEIEDRLRVVWPDPEKTETLEAGGVRVDVFRLSHGTGRHQEIQNLGHVIDLGGKKTLHIGDAEFVVANFEPFDLRARELDVAIVPYWYYPKDTGRYLVSEHFHAEHEIAAHVPTEEVENIFKGFRMEVRWVLVPQEPMESWTF